MNSERRLYGDTAEIEKLLCHMQLMESAVGGLASVHQDKSTGAFWLNCYATSGAQGGGYQLLIRLPLPKTEELARIALTSKYEDEAVAAILRLLDEEALEQKDFRLLLLEMLEEDVNPALPEAEKKRYITIIKLAALDDPMNRKDVLGKSKDEVQKDASYFREISDRAKAVLNSLT